MNFLNINDIEIVKNNIPHKHPIACLFSGGLDSAYLLFTLKDLGFKELYALTTNIGQSDCEEAERIAKQIDVHWILIEAKNEFVEDFIFPAIYSHGVYLGGHPISASLSRPLIAKKSVEFCLKHKINFILHTSSSSQNSLRRFDSAFKYLNFPGSFGSPFAFSRISRSDKLKQLQSTGINWNCNRLYSLDDNLWTNEFEYGDSENPEDIVISNDMLKWTRVTNTKPIEISLEFTNGIPSKLNGELQTGSTVVQNLNKIVGSFGHGVYVWLEELQEGQKVQEIREAPAARILFDAYRRLESAVLGSEQIREKLHVEQLWVREASEGRWFGELRAACQAFNKELAKNVTGEVRYLLTTTQIVPRSVKASRPLYIRDRENYETYLSQNSGKSQ